MTQKIFFLRLFDLIDKKILILQIIGNNEQTGREADELGLEEATRETKTEIGMLL